MNDQEKLQRAILLAQQSQNASERAQGLLSEAYLSLKGSLQLLRELGNVKEKWQPRRLFGSRFSYASGGIAGFSGDGQWFAYYLNNGKFQWILEHVSGFKIKHEWWEGAHQFFMWLPGTARYVRLWGNPPLQQKIEIFDATLGGSEHQATLTLPHKVDGRDVIWYQTPHNLHGNFYLKGWDQQADEDFWAEFVFDGSVHWRGGFWVSETNVGRKLHNPQPCAAGILTHITGAKQHEVYLVRLKGMAGHNRLAGVENVMPLKRPTHIAVDGRYWLIGHTLDLTTTPATATNGWSLFKDGKHLREFTQEMFKAALDTSYVVVQHADIRNGRIVFSCQDHRTGEWSIVLSDLSGQNMRVSVSGIEVIEEIDAKGQRVWGNDVAPTIGNDGQLAFHDADDTRIMQAPGL